MSEQPEETERVHGKNCEKILHIGTGYLHAEDDDRPYDVDGVMYCGRCHHFLPMQQRFVSDGYVEAFKKLDQKNLNKFGDS